MRLIFACSQVSPGPGKTDPAWLVPAGKVGIARLGLPFFCHEATIRRRLFSLLYNPFSLEVPG
jgi:hypothetical protein